MNNKNRLAMRVLLTVGFTLGFAHQGESQPQVMQFEGCVDFVKYIPSQVNEQLQTRAYISVRNQQTGEARPFGFFQNGIRHNTRSGARLRTSDFQQQIEPLLAQIREAARDRVHVQFNYDLVTQVVTSYLIRYDRPCQMAMVSVSP